MSLPSQAWRVRGPPRLYERAHPSPPPHSPRPHTPLPQAIDAYQVEDYRLSASMNVLNVAQSIVIYSGMAAGLLVCTKVSSACAPCPGRPGQAAAAADGAGHTLAAHLNARLEHTRYSAPS